ncbi:E3 binding domain-containing protein [Rhodococcus sp. HS-D2]|uniref:E3 binding domain-containing protein n=1 Tax=Rhodococcus sp. HS-D2 TaxID=1384636 RepID=UPI0007DA2AE9|nr:E3 binding domain-containing protein [Rhodococcus sp. HS-D2]
MAADELPTLAEFAAKRKVDLSQVQGTGPDGAVTYRDVDRAAAAPIRAAIEARRARRAARREVEHARAEGREVVARTIRDLFPSDYSS